MKTVSFVLCLTLLLLAGNTPGADFFLEKVWTGAYSAYSSGLGWADFDNNGWPDLYSGNGFDLVYRANTIYFNFPDSLRAVPGYFSHELDPTGMITIGDLDNDGDPDVVVSSLSDFNAGAPPYPQYIYYSHNGTLDTTYSWLLTGTLGWSNAVGDYDGDGDLDVAFALGDRYTGQLTPSRVFKNNNGVISSMPSWTMGVNAAASDVAFVDVDLDGDLDLAFTGGGMYEYLGGGAVIYYNNNGTIESSPSWVSSNCVGGPQLDFGDLDGDGYPELAVAGGLPLSSGGHVYVFKNNGGTLEATPFLDDPTGSPMSSVAWGDMDGDGDLDLVAGGNGDPTRIYRNDDGVLTDTGVYLIDSLSWTTMISLMDYDQDWVIDTFKTYTGNGSLHLYSLEQKPLHKIISVEINGSPLSLSQYCYELEKGWVSLGIVPGVGDEVRINYQFSRDLDVVLSCWGGAFLYDNASRDLTFSYPTGLPYLVKKGMTTEVTVQVESNASGIPVTGSGKFHYSFNGEPYTAVNMEATGSNQYRTTIPAVTDCDAELRYFFSVKESLGRTFYSVDTTGGHTFTVYTSSVVDFQDNFQTNKYWGVYGSATEGDWERGIPASDGTDGAPTSDYDGTGYCYLTGNSQGVDVDNGNTYMVSPGFELADTAVSFISFAFWFNNQCGTQFNDYFRVYLSNDDENNWTLIKEIAGDAPEAAGGWQTHFFVVNDYMAPTLEMKLKFEVADVSPESCLEAAVDDIKVTSFLCSPSCCIGETGNVNCDPEELVDISDITRLIDYLYISKAPLCCPEEADANGSGGEPDISDITSIISFLYISHEPLAPCL